MQERVCTEHLKNKQTLIDLELCLKLSSVPRAWSNAC